MPEGDTLYRTAAGLRPYLVGRAVTAARAQGPGPVPQVHRVIGRGVTWHQAAKFAVNEVCGRHDDARVGEVRRLFCHLEGDGAVRMSAELAISVKYHPMKEQEA